MNTESDDMKKVLSLLIICTWNITSGVKILMVPGNCNSHVLKFSRLAEGLSAQGHTIRLILPSNNKMASHMYLNENFTVEHYRVSRDIPFTNGREMSEFAVRTALSKSAWERLQVWMAVEELYGEASLKEREEMMENKQFIEMMKEDGYQFAIMDPWMAPSCFMLIPKMLNIPFAVYTFPVHWMNFLAKIPRLPSVTPTMCADDSDEMTFQQRLITFVVELLLHLKYSLSYETETIYAQRYVDPNLETSYNELMSNASLWFFEEDLSLYYPYVHMPNSVSIVNIGNKLRPVKPLPDDLESFLQSSTEPAILVSFGSFFDYVSDYLAQGFCDAFRQLKYQVVWKLKNESHCINVKNVKILDWIPQNDLLAHEKVRLFITHGGFNSMVETVYHAKPVINIPIVADQINLAAFVVKKGMGIRMYHNQFSVKSLVENIEEMFINPKYAVQMRAASAIMRDEAATAAEKASYLINHVVKHGDRHLKTGAHQLSLFQYYMIDVFLFIVLVVLSCLALMSISVYYVCTFAFTRIKFAKKLKAS